MRLSVPPGKYWTPIGPLARGAIADRFVAALQIIVKGSIGCVTTSSFSMSKSSDCSLLKNLFVRGSEGAPRGRKTKKNEFSAQQKYFAPYGDLGRFDVTEWSGNILRIDLDPSSPIFCLTE